MRLVIIVFALGCSTPPEPVPEPEPEPIVELHPELEPPEPEPPVYEPPVYDYSVAGCPITKWADGYWVPVESVHTESCSCYKIRAKLNGEKGDCSK